MENQEEPIRIQDLFINFFSCMYAITLFIATYERETLLQGFTFKGSTSGTTFLGF